MPSPIRVTVMKNHRDESRLERGRISDDVTLSNLANHRAVIPAKAGIQ